MSNEKDQTFTKEAEQLRQKRDSLFRLFDRHLHKEMSKKQGFQSELPITSLFLIDGSVKIPFEYFSKLPDWLKEFFLDKRISRPPSASVFADYNESETDPGTLGYIQNNTKHVALRGSRFWDFDGSKANFGPDGAEAVDLLFDNVDGDIKIIGSLIEFDPQNEFEWAASVAAWEYIKNDFCAIYYSLKCRLAKVDTASAHELSLVDLALEFISNRYFDSILMFKTDPSRGSSELEEILVNIEKLKTTLKDFITDPSFADRDLLRSQREVNNPLSLMNAFRLVYKIDEATGRLIYTDEIRKTDAILSPLYGGIDLAYAFKYALGEGQKFAEQLFDTQLDEDRRDIKVLSVLSKIGSKGVIRSQLSSTSNPIAALSTDEIVGNREKKWLAGQIPNAKRLMIVDDSLATGKSADIFAKWVKEALGHSVEHDFRAIYANFRWAKYQMPINKLMETDPLTQAPISRNMKRSLYPMGSRFMPDAMSNHLQQKTERTCLDLHEALQIILNLYNDKIIQAVGLDLDDTLILRTLDSKERRHKINLAVVEILEDHGYHIDLQEYAINSYQILNRERKLSELDHDYPIDIIACNQAILRGFDIDDQEELGKLAELMLEAELEVDQDLVIPAPGARELLETLTGLGVNFGIFSNSHYRREELEQILSFAGLNEFFNDKVIMGSATVGIPRKPDAQAIKILAQEMNVVVQDLAYIGNSFGSDIVGATKSGGVAIYTPQPIDDIGKKEISKIKNWREHLENV